MKSLGGTVMPTSGAGTDADPLGGPVREYDHEWPSISPASSFAHQTQTPPTIQASNLIFPLRICIDTLRTSAPQNLLISI